MQVTAGLLLAFTAFYWPSQAAAASSSLRSRRLVQYYPYIEPGFDFVDHDVANAPGTTIADCKPVCAARADCHAYSWNGYNGGTCWLKSARDVVVVNAAVKSAYMWTTDQTTKVCKPHQDVDYVDNDLVHFSGKAFSDCCDLCHTYLGCRAYSWNSDNGGTCWLKSKRGQVITKSGVISADAYPTDDVAMPVQFDTDYVDHDIGHAPSATYQGCFAICTNTAGCHAFAWSPFAGGTCWLKAMAGAAIYKQGVVAAKVSLAVDDCTWHSDTDYVDHDIGSVSGIGNADDCCQICKGWGNCKAFAWSSYLGGTCWLKSVAGTSISSPGVKAATTP